MERTTRVGRATMARPTLVAPMLVARRIAVDARRCSHAEHEQRFVDAAVKHGDRVFPACVEYFAAVHSGHSCQFAWRDVDRHTLKPPVWCLDYVLNFYSLVRIRTSLNQRIKAQKLCKLRASARCSEPQTGLGTSIKLWAMPKFDAIASPSALIPNVSVA